MWIKFDDTILNIDTGAKFEIETRNQYGDENKLPELVYSIPAGAIDFDGLPMGGTVRTILNRDTIELLRQNLYELLAITNAIQTGIEFNKGA